MAPVVELVSVITGRSVFLPPGAATPVLNRLPVELLPTFVVLWQVPHVPVTVVRVLFLVSVVSFMPPTSVIVMGSVLNNFSPRPIEASASETGSVVVRPSQALKTVNTGSGGTPCGLVVTAKGSLLFATNACCESAVAPPVTLGPFSDPAELSEACAE